MSGKTDEAHRRKVSNLTDAIPSFGHQFNATMSLPFVQGKDVLDIGCWTGQMAMILAPYSKSYTGLDPSKDAIQLAKDTVPEGNFIVAQAESMKFKSKSFDTVLLLDVIEHVPPGTEDTVYKNIHRILKDNGHLILTTPSSHPISILLDPAYFLISHRHYSVETLESQLKNAGFQVKHVIKTGNIVGLLAHNFEMFCKHIFKVKVQLPQAVQKIIKSGYEVGGFAEIHLIAQKKTS